LAKHVGKPVEFLAGRLRNESHLWYSSTFYSRQHAENAICDLLRTRRPEINGWLAGREPGVELSARAPRQIGITLLRGSARPMDVQGIVVRLRRDSQMAVGYRILTAFPQP